MGATCKNAQDARSVLYLGKLGIDTDGHEAVTQRAQARKIAGLLGYVYEGDIGHEHLEGRCAGMRERSDEATRVCYLVPGDTLHGELAGRVGVREELDLFGGVVPHPFIATKTITHGLIDANAPAPQGWSNDFAGAVREVALPGYSAFSFEDALVAGKRLLENGPVRVKLASGVGGLGQAVAHDARELERVLQAFDEEGGLAQGVVLETNLGEIATYSAGRVRLGDLIVTYYGQQRLTRDNRGGEVYGGSQLMLVRGDFDVLLGHELAPNVRQALEQASVYHAAALRCYPGLFASRCNYDIAQGRDAAGNWHSGVLEQSWRIGGASGAELEAITAFLDDPELQAVRASTIEIYGPDVEPPADATVYYAGEDPRVGQLTKYARIEGYGHA